MRLFIVLSAAAFLVVYAATAGEPTIYLGAAAGDTERFAALELQRYLYAVGGDVLPIREVDGVTHYDVGFILGTPDSLPDTGINWPFGLEPPKADGYLLHSIDWGNTLIVVGGQTTAGVQNGVYALLEAFGYGFYLSGDTLPESLPNLWAGKPPTLHVSASPAFVVRGSLPWHSYFCGPVAWELEDYKAYIDQLARMRLNFVGFHCCDTGPFAAYELDGQLVGGEPLPNTSEPFYGTQPLRTNHFLAGAGAYFARKHFGAGSSFINDREESMLEARAALGDAIVHAKARGIRVCLGFDVHGDPLNATVQAEFDARLKNLLIAYPLVDYIWIWEPEAMALATGQAPPPRSLWDSYARRWDAVFDYIEEPERRAEAVRLALFALRAQRILEAEKRHVGLIVSGWGGDAWMRCTDFFPGMDKLLAPDIVFSALDNMPVTPSVSDAYGVLPPERERWPILWLEYDGDLWMPQPNLRELAGACRDALQKGCQGLLGMHWRTRAVDEAAAYCAQFAWDTDLTVEDFCRHRAENLFGPDLAGKGADILLRLQQLGYRWVGGTGQHEWAPFAWGIGDETKRRELAIIQYDLRLLAESGKSLSERLIPDLGAFDKVLSSRTRRKGVAAAEDLAMQAEYVLAFDDAASRLAPGAGLDALIARVQLDEALELIQYSGFREALHSYAQRIGAKGELGVLAAINNKAWVDLRERTGMDGAELRRLEMYPEEYGPVVRALPDRVIVAGMPQNQLTVNLQVRPLRQTGFTTYELDAIGGASYALAFPEEITRTGVFEYGVEVLEGRRKRLEWPPGFPANTATATSFVPSLPQTPAEPAHDPVWPTAVDYTVSKERYSIELGWMPKPGQTYAVYRDGQHLATVPDGWFEDTTPEAGAQLTYGVVARHLQSGQTAYADVVVEAQDLPLPKPPAPIHAASRAGWVVLGWRDNAPQAAYYSVTRYNEDLEPTAESLVKADYRHYIQVADKTGGTGAHTYAITPIAPDGRPGDPSRFVGVVVSDQPLRPRVQLAFEDKAFLTGLAQLADNALALGGKGWSGLPAQPEWDADRPLTVSLWLKPETLEGMPVLICKGPWDRASYYLQIVRGRVRFRLSGAGTLDAGAPESGVWQHVVATFGKGEMRLYINGATVGRKQANWTGDADASLPEYPDLNDDAYLVRGLLDDIRIYDATLAPEETRALYRQTLRE